MALTILPEPSLKDRTTLKLGGTALAEVVVRDATDLDELPGFLAKEGGDALVLGQGSNILARDGRLPLVLIRSHYPTGPEITGEEGEKVRLKVGAGQKLPRLLGWLQSRGLSGLEPMTGIPGSIGGAVAMNAGSYGREFKDVLVKVTAWTPRTGVVQLLPGDWETGYRRFRPNVQGEPFIVLEVELLFKRLHPAEIKAQMTQWFSRKKSTQPLKAASAGCVFKNPPGESAGKLLDQAGFRGFKHGGMAFSEMHANFMINIGSGRSDEAFELIETAQAKVKAQSGIDLALEVKVCPWH